MRFRWPEESVTALDDPPSGEVGFAMPAAIVLKPTSCELLDEGESAALAAGDGFSDTHILIRCTELSKLLRRGDADKGQNDTHEVRKIEGCYSLDVGRIHLHERGVRHEDVRHVPCHVERHLPVVLRGRAWGGHEQRGRRTLECG